MKREDRIRLEEEQAKRQRKDVRNYEWLCDNHDLGKDCVVVAPVPVEYGYTPARPSIVGPLTHGDNLYSYISGDLDAFCSDWQVEPHHSTRYGTRKLQLADEFVVAAIFERPGRFYFICQEGIRAKLKNSRGYEVAHYRTLAVVHHPERNVYGIGIAYCSMKESVNKKKGRTIAVVRARQALQLALEREAEREARRR